MTTLCQFGFSSPFLESSGQKRVVWIRITDDKKDFWTDEKTAMSGITKLN